MLVQIFVIFKRVMEWKNFSENINDHYLYVLMDNIVEVQSFLFSEEQSFLSSEEQENFSNAWCLIRSSTFILSSGFLCRQLEIIFFKESQISSRNSTSSVFKRLISSASSSHSHGDLE